MKRKPTPHEGQTPTPPNITYRLIKEFRREPLNDDNTRNMVVWWVVQWCRCPEIVLEKRRIYVSSKTGQLKTYKQMPWNLKDLKWLSENWAEILEALQS